MNRREEIDQVAIRVTEQHGTVAPWLRRWLEDKGGDRSLEAPVLLVHIIDLELNDRRPIGCRDSRAGIVQVHRALATDREGPDRGSELDVVCTSHGTYSGHFLIEPDQGGNIVRSNSSVRQLHVTFMFGGYWRRQGP